MWVITKDHISDGADEGVGSRYYKKGIRLPHRFKMYDDDGELYYEGLSSDKDVFNPLDDFGMPNAGCTEIKYLTDGKWETL